jgi:hypothetical protein
LSVDRGQLDRLEIRRGFEMGKVGAKTWFVPDCYYPGVTNGKVYISHEAICVLNTGDIDAEIKITLYFEDRDKVEGFVAECKAERTNHIRLDKIRDGKGNGIPMGVPYAIMLESNTEIIAQYSRLDTTQAEMGLMTTMAYHG